MPTLKVFQTPAKCSKEIPSNPDTVDHFHPEAVCRDTYLEGHTKKKKKKHDKQNDVH